MSQTSNIFNTTGAVGTRQVEDGELLTMNMPDINLSRINRTTFGRNTAFGFNNVISNTELILSPGVPVNSLNISFPLGATTMQVASTSANDTSAGIGARTLRVRGLDENYRRQDETITLNGLTPVSTTSQFIRINDLFVLTAGSTGSNEGSIHITDANDTFTSGEPNTTLYCSIGIADNLSKTLVYTVPEGEVWAPMGMYIQTDAVSTDTIKLNFFTQNPSRAGVEVYQLSDIFFIQQGGIEIDISNNRQLTSRSDFWMTAERVSGNGDKSLHIKLFAILKKLYN